ncbi:AAA family ATPase [Roseomonas sp. SSH11]|uniref:AAA family ATPase n=1 Tax=Pararoseomonas baculiformis TaxID=2820812 RepID=A0ABS4AI70_9PROT|nr:AAA family ATPase [Pararoseomonas baculiformis]MBP0446228.1 AAA family ATPase [Pararoseomonas baculiformis]
MRLLKAKVKGYQSFEDSGEIFFQDRTNLIVGQNNAGKSALLRSLTSHFSDDRHRTPERWEAFRLPLPEVNLTLSVNGAEIRSAILQSNSPQVIPIAQDQLFDGVGFVQNFLQMKSLEITLRRAAGQQFTSSYPTHGLFYHAPESPQYGVTLYPQNGDVIIQMNDKSGDTLAGLIGHAWEQDMFHFTAERMTIGESSYGYATRLLPNAGNLPNVLHTLYTERWNVFQRLVGHVKDVFSTVGNLSVRIRPENNNIEVRVWPTEDMERVELSFPLNSSGTGVSQVVAILAAIMTRESATIIIDEVNSFLHPAAVKALLRILQTNYSNHQYIISTHSPEVISYSNTTTVHLVKRRGYSSSVELLNLSEVGNFQDVAQHLGVSMSDVFAADRVIWVEGPTEEICFLYLYRELVGPLPRGLIISSVAATGDFNSNKRDPAIVFDVYNRLASATAPLVASVIFSFDTEKLTEIEKNEMRRASRNRLHFLPRRHLECYLLNAEAIADFINTKLRQTAETVNPAQVQEILVRLASARPFLIREWSGDLRDTEWLARVDGANLIKAACSEISSNRAPFAKNKDSLHLLRYIVKNSPEFVSSLRDYVSDLVETASKSDNEQVGTAPAT